MTTNRIVISAQTDRHEVDRLVAVARNEAKRRKRFLRRLRIAMTVACVLIVAAMIVGVVALAMGVR